MMPGQDDASPQSHLQAQTSAQTNHHLQHCNSSSNRSLVFVGRDLLTEPATTAMASSSSLSSSATGGSKDTTAYTTSITPQFFLQSDDRVRNPT
ncbi:hypothetical protein C8034_v010576 [Colletotrichum sidae]|uniref:Uncharacterized protein n=1 Tax=Colletotrichum sidae TaxID=1347389 RepID=A0A4R8TLM7_9PEZI|nr:hypothetical protein C8034_v010576 [Colletotrichum sidae]